MMDFISFLFCLSHPQANLGGKKKKENSFDMDYYHYQFYYLNNETIKKLKNKKEIKTKMMYNDGEYLHQH